MKIVYAHPVPMPSRAANTVQVVKACDALGKAGASVTLATPWDGSGEDKRARLLAFYGVRGKFSVRQFAFNKLPGREIIFGCQISAYAYFNRADVIYTRSITIAFVTTGFGIPTVLELHQPLDGQREDVRNRFAKLLRRRAFVALVVISKKLRAYFENTTHVLSSRIIDIPLGGDLNDRPLTSNVSDTTGLSVGYTGHLYPGKGMEIILPVARACPWAEFHVVGGEPADISYWKRRADGVSNLTFHGHVPHSKVDKYVASFDVVLGPYLRVVEGVGGNSANLAEWMSPLKIFEYMAQGKAIVASDLPVLREILIHGETALLCSPKKIDEWVNALACLRQNSELRTFLGSNARTRMEREYTREVWAKKILAELVSRLV